MTIVHQVHTSFGGVILMKWGFPEVFIRAAREHEELSVSEKIATEVLIVYLANRLSRRIGFSLFEEAGEVPILEGAKLLNINPGALGEVIEEIKHAVVGLHESL